MSVKESMTASSSVRTQRAPTPVGAVKDSLSTVTTEHAMVQLRKLKILLRLNFCIRPQLSSLVREIALLAVQ